MAEAAVVKLYDINKNDATDLMLAVLDWYKLDDKPSKKALKKLVRKRKKNWVTEIVPFKGEGPPSVGDWIYLQSSFFIGHSQDDFCGGLAQVSKVEDGMSAGKMMPFIQVKQKPGSSMNWAYLEKEQEKFAKQYGNMLAHPCPD